MQKSYPQLTADLPANPLPDSFEIVPTKAENTEPVALSIQDAKLAGVGEVKYGKETSRRILQIAKAIQVVFLIAVIILLVASTILIANTIRLSIFARRREIEVMKLVGATNWFVRGPFMLEGLLTGLAGSVSAILLLLLSRESGRPADPRPHPQRPRRPCARLQLDRGDPPRRRPRDRRARVGDDAPPLPPRLRTAVR